MGVVCRVLCYAVLYKEIFVCIYVPSKLSISKYGLISRVSRANCTVCTVALLPEPWKASRVGLTGPLFDLLGASPGVRYVGF
jgi:hypothetical protein